MFKKRILVLGNSAPGAKVFRTELLSALLKNHEVFLGCPPHEECRKFFQSLGCTYINTLLDRRGMNPAKDILLFLRYCYIIHKIKPDIIITYTIKPNIYGGLLSNLFRIPYIATVEGLGTVFTQDGVLNKLIKKLYYLGMHSAKTVFYLNDHIYEVLTKMGIKKTQLKYIPGMGANLSFFVPTPYPSDHPFKLLTVGRIMKEKGIPEILQVADVLAKDLPELEWHICGAPERGEEHLVDELKKRQNIIYHGAQKDMRPFYQAAHATTTTTYHEGMSTICIESSACARPVLGTHIHGVFETIEEGKTGFTFPPHDVKSTIEKIKFFFSLSNDDRATMGLKARKKIEKEFDRNIVVKEYLEIIGDICLNKK